MKFKIGKEPLMTALQKVSAAVSVRSPIPVLSNILLSAGNGQVCLTATDLDMSVRAVTPAAVEKAGETTLPAKILPSIVHDAPTTEMEFELMENETTRILAGSAVFMLRGISAVDFPPLPSPGDARPLAVAQKVIKTMLQRVGYAASTDESRRVLNGTLLRFKDGRLTAVATDGRRLALIEHELDTGPGDALDLVVPTKSVNELVRSLGEKGEVRIRSTSNQAIFEAEDFQIYTKLMEGVYPNYTQVIPSQSSIRIVLERELFMSAIRRVALMTNEKSNSVRLNFGKNRVDVTASADIGEARETVPLKYDGEEISIAFNPGLLIEPLKYLVSDEIALEMSNPTSPGVIKTDEPFLYVIMPMMIS